MPRVALHVSPGTGSPFGSLGWQVPVLHHCTAVQSLSCWQPVPQLPVCTLQKGPGCVPTAQSAFWLHLPQAPDAAQYGATPLGQAEVACEPMSPLQA